MTSKDNIRRILNEELSKSDINKISKEDNDKLLKSKEFELRVKQITTKVIEEFYKILWTKKNFWSDTISK